MEELVRILIVRQNSFPNIAFIASEDDLGFGVGGRVYFHHAKTVMDCAPQCNVSSCSLCALKGYIMKSGIRRNKSVIGDAFISK